MAPPGVADKAAELFACRRERLASFECPRSIGFERELPRHPMGKLYKQAARGRHWPA